MQTTASPHAPGVGDAAPNAKLVTANGQELDLASFWREAQNGALVVFLRNFGCMFCREQAKRLREAQSDLDARQIHLVAIGVGTPESAAEFAVWLKLTYPVFGIPDTSLHAAWGLGKAAAGDMLNPGLVTAGFRALRGGNLQGKPTGDSRQLPGMFLVVRDGVIRWARRSGHSGDNPTNRELFEAIDAALSSRQ